MDLRVALLGPIDQVHLVDAHHQVGNAEQTRQEDVPARLFTHAFSGIHQDDREIGGGRAGDHVARVLKVPGRVGDDDLASRRREVAVGDVDGDALFPLGA